MDDVKPLPVAVIGAGPVGLAAAAHLLTRGHEPLIFEAGETRRRQRARLGARARLLALGVQHRPRGGRPARGRRLDGAARPSVPDRRRDRRALPRAAGRAAGDRRPAGARRARHRGHAPAGSTSSRTPGREQAPFELHASTTAAIEQRVRCPRGDRRLRDLDAPQPARRRRRARRRASALDRERIFYGIPDVLGADRDALRRQARPRRRQRPLGLQRAARPRRAAPSRRRPPRSRGPCAATRPATSSAAASADQLPERGALGDDGARGSSRRPAPSQLVTGFQTRSVGAPRRADHVIGDGERELGRPTRSIATTGFRPDLSRARRAAARPRRPRRGAARARAADRPQRALLRHRPAARRRRALATPSRTSTSSA